MKRNQKQERNGKKERRKKMKEYSRDEKQINKSVCKKEMDKNAGKKIRFGENKHQEKREG